MCDSMRIRIGVDVLDIAAARAAVRAVLAEEKHPASVTVSLPAGDYSPEDFVFGPEDCADDCRVIYEADAGAAIRGGLVISADAWQMPDDAMAARLPAEVRDRVRMVSLAAFGLNADDWGDPAAGGPSSTANRYDDYIPVHTSELFCGDCRMTLARYPNKGSYAKLSAIVDVGDCYEFPQQNYFEDWHQRRNHRPGTYVVDRVTAKRMEGWKEPTTAWMFGYFFHDWSDSSTPVGFVDAAHRLVSPRFVSVYGARADASYYFYNVPEELDEPGEWYLDRANGQVYFYPYENADSLEFSCSTRPLICCEQTRNMTFTGFTLSCTVADSAVSVRGDDMIFTALTVKNVAGSAFSCTGSRNTVSDCDISHTGRGGIILNGGDRVTLTPGENRAVNNYIHDYAEIITMYAAGVQLGGVGNVCAHNEICRAPHMAIGYSGNDHLIEYNNIHDAVRISNDAGAIYSGRDWTAYGTVIRYNILRDLGGNGFKPQGIYWDDGLSGQTAIGNLLINAGENSFLIGGGRDCVVEGNVMIDSSRTAIFFDQRNRDGFFHDGWARAATNNPNTGHWSQLRSMPYTSPVWASRFPHLAAVKVDFSTPKDDPDFAVNPSYASVRGNVAIGSFEREPYNLAEGVLLFGTMENNAVYTSFEDAGWNAQTMTFAPDSPVFCDVPGFVDIPVAEIGRTGE